MLVTGNIYNRKKKSKPFSVVPAILDITKHEMAAYDLKYSSPDRVPYVSKRQSLTGITYSK